MDHIKYKTITSPVGLLKIIVEEKKLIAILWDNEKLNRVRLGDMVEDPKDSLILDVEKQLNEYFFHNRKKFNLPTKTYGTQFQMEVWELLNQIPYGSTMSYKDIAIQANRPLAVRAVGAAIGRNPISIIIPCHRVIATNGSLMGFAGGINRKKLLLDLEAKDFKK